MDLFSETFLIVVLLAVTHLSIYLYLKKKPPKDIKDRHVVVTGGSSGIGLWVAIHCAKLGAHVTIIARKVANLGRFDGRFLYAKVPMEERESLILGSIDRCGDFWMVISFLLNSNCTKKCKEVFCLT